MYSYLYEQATRVCAPDQRGVRACVVGNELNALQTCIWLKTDLKALQKTCSVCVCVCVAKRESRVDGRDGFQNLRPKNAIPSPKTLTFLVKGCVQIQCLILSQTSGFIVARLNLRNYAREGATSQRMALTRPFPNYTIPNHVNYRN